VKESPVARTRSRVEPANYCRLLSQLVWLLLKWLRGARWSSGCVLDCRGSDPGQGRNLDRDVCSMRTRTGEDIE